MYEFWHFVMLRVITEQILLWYKHIEQYITITVKSITHADTRQVLGVRPRNNFVILFCIVIHINCKKELQSNFWITIVLNNDQFVTICFIELPEMW